MTNDKLFDDTLMQLIQHGDALAFDSLVTRHSDCLVGWFQKRTNSFEQSQDLAQDVLLAIFESSHLYEVGSHFRSWMFRIAANRLVDHQRTTSEHARRQDGRLSPNLKKGRVVHASSERDLDLIVAEAVARERGPAEQAETQELCDLIRSALDGIDCNQREVLLDYYGGMSLPEIAKLTGTCTATVKSRKRIGMKNMLLKLGRDPIPVD